MDTSFRSRSGDHGTEVTALPVALGNATANATTTTPVPMLRRKLWVRGASYQCSTKLADGDGTVVARLVKRKTDGTQVVLSSDLDLEGVTENVPAAFTIPASTPESSRVVQPGELLQVLIVSNSAAIDTQHANASVVVDACLLQ